MSRPFILAAQLHSFPHLVIEPGVDQLVARVRRSADAAGIEILIPGGAEIPALYDSLTSSSSRPARQVFLWLPVLADAPGCTADRRVINFKGIPSPGWGSPEMQAEAGETFQFACPNHPDMIAAALENLERQLCRYPFDGVFLDKIRFPSPANGIGDLLTCFCPYCRSAAAAEGLDLEKVREYLSGWPEKLTTIIPTGAGLSACWLDELLIEQALLREFLVFRANTINALVSRLAALARSLGRRVALDLFSPGLGLLVGQDYRALAPMADWIKPMSYRYAAGPAGLRLEIPSLIEGISTHLGISIEQVENWAAARVPGLAGEGATGLAERIAAHGAPLELIAAETGRATELAHTTPVFMGVEAVSIPAFQVNISPQHVRRVVGIAKQFAAGAVLSWDILNMPLENLQAAREAALNVS